MLVSAGLLPVTNVPSVLFPVPQWALAGLSGSVAGS
jgi:hypothetical protein